MLSKLERVKEVVLRSKPFLVRKMEMQLDFQKTMIDGIISNINQNLNIKDENIDFEFYKTIENIEGLMDKDTKKYADLELIEKLINYLESEANKLKGIN